MKEKVDYIDDEVLQSIWSLVNQNCTDQQRAKFNEFKSYLYLKSDALRDWVRRRSLPCKNEVAIPSEMEYLIDAICAIAHLMK